MQPGANATAAAIITYSLAADAGKRVGLVRIPHPGTSFDTGHLPAGPPPYHPSAFRWPEPPSFHRERMQSRGAFKDNVWEIFGVMLSCSSACMQTMFPSFSGASNTPRLALEM